MISRDPPPRARARVQPTLLAPRVRAACPGLGHPWRPARVGDARVGSGAVEALSLGVAALMIVINHLGLIYGMKLEPSPLSWPSTQVVADEPGWSMRSAVIVLVGSTLGTVWSA